MTIFSWFNKNSGDRTADADSSGLSRIESTRPAVGARDAKESPAGNAQPANRKSERMARRELLYSVVRESMTRAGVLSASYKFKVLSLDARARQFLVMVDLVSTAGLDAPRFGEVEAMIAQGAKNRYDIIVTAVYWRMHDHVAIGTSGVAAPAATPGAVSAASTRALPLTADAAKPALFAAAGASTSGIAALPPAVSGPGAIPPRAPRSNAQEVAEFRRALAAGLAKPAAVAATATALPLPRTVPAAENPAPATRGTEGTEAPVLQNYTLLTGFEDTELGDSQIKRRSLSGSQFGDLN